MIEYALLSRSMQFLLRTVSCVINWFLNLGLEFAQWSNEIIVKLWFIRMNISGSFFETFIWD